jgi:hypothetical protein
MSRTVFVGAKIELSVDRACAFLKLKNKRQGGTQLPPVAPMDMNPRNLDIYLYTLAKFGLEE